MRINFSGKPGRLRAAAEMLIGVYFIYRLAAFLPAGENEEFAEYAFYVRACTYVMMVFFGLLFASRAAEVFLKPPWSHRVSGFIQMQSCLLIAGVFIFVGVEFIYPLNGVMCAVMTGFGGLYAYAGISKVLKQMRCPEKITETCGSFTESMVRSISPEVLGKIDEIDSLHKAGIISDEEYEEQKKEILSGR